MMFAVMISIAASPATPMLNAIFLLFSAMNRAFDLSYFFPEFSDALVIARDLFEIDLSDFPN
jgi:hypothetical protein